MAGNDALQTGLPDRVASGDPDHESLDWEGDSAMGDSIASSTVSMSSSIAQYDHQHGRRYHAYHAGQYFMPNDEEEQDLMDLVHDGHLFLAPLEEPTSILDIGTGTGTWAFDIADLFPGAFVLGTDLSPIQPSWVPTNLQFEVSDCEDEWTFSTRFDLIHVRNMSGSITDWPKLLSQVHEYLKHGGWFDAANIDVWIESNSDALPEDSALVQWRSLLAEAAVQAGREPRSARLLRQRLIAAGFVSVTEEVFKVYHERSCCCCTLLRLDKLPLSSWMQPQDHKWKRIARLMQYLMERELEGLSLALFTRVLKWSVEELRELLSRVRAEMANLEYELYCNVYCVYGQKPYEASGDPFGIE